MADLNLGTFAPEDVIVVISHPDFTHVVSGYADGTFVSVERTLPSSTFYQGADNSGGRVLRSNKAGTITLTLHQFSASNDVLSAIYLADIEARDNTYLFNLSITDGSGRSKFFARQCAIGNLPSVGYGNDVETRDWILEAIELDQYVGGNAIIPPDVLTTLEALGVPVDDKWRP